MTSEEIEKSMFMLKLGQSFLVRNPKSGSKVLYKTWHEEHSWIDVEVYKTNGDIKPAVVFLNDALRFLKTRELITNSMKWSEHE